MRQDFYVYGHFDARGMCRYIGKGRAERAWSFYQRSKRWKELFSEARPSVRIFDKGLDENGAYCCTGKRKRHKCLSWRYA